MIHVRIRNCRRENKSRGLVSLLPLCPALRISWRSLSPPSLPSPENGQLFPPPPLEQIIQSWQLSKFSFYPLSPGVLLQMTLQDSRSLHNSPFYSALYSFHSFALILFTICSPFIALHCSAWQWSAFNVYILCIPSSLCTFCIAFPICIGLLSLSLLSYLTLKCLHCKVLL